MKLNQRLINGERVSVTNWAGCMRSAELNPRPVGVGGVELSFD
jgi:hypothetical protein